MSERRYTHQARAQAVRSLPLNVNYELVIKRRQDDQIKSRRSRESRVSLLLLQMLSGRRCGFTHPVIAFLLSRGSRPGIKKHVRPDNMTNLPASYVPGETMTLQRAMSSDSTKNPSWMHPPLHHCGFSWPVRRAMAAGKEDSARAKDVYLLVASQRAFSTRPSI
ncbi:hypothetical protein BJV74DRAFT_799793 [Russula compacta]|nr:hypothetical protein BJV74DRAFT_799793 [Russula compacta]